LRPSPEPYRDGVAAFFDNLLPDNREIRERIQRRFNTRSLGAFDLLQEIGRDCLGALQLMPEGKPPPSIGQISRERLTTNGVERLLSGTLASTFHEGEADEDAFRISLAGAQEKTALLWHKGAWLRPTHATPTTHILKLPMGINTQGIDLSTSVENEWLCARIAQQYGIEVATCRMATFGQYKTLVVERFDRRLAPEKVRMAMAVTGKSRHYRWKEIHARHWIETARRQGSGDMKQIMSEVIAGTPAALDRVRDLVPTGFPKMNTRDFLRSGVPLGEATGRAADLVAQYVLRGGVWALLGEVFQGSLEP
jgi:serine/threonine protein kinase HipA of HipAB toxin-antitoxin module